MKKALLTLWLIILVNKFYAQQIQSFDYPNGIYNTAEDFENKTPSLNGHNNLSIERIKLIGQTDSLIRRCFFIDKSTDKKIKKVFAIVFESKIYFNTGAILKNKNKKDKGLSASSKKEFVLVLFGGNNYLYAEVGLINHWKVGLSNGASSGLGGITGYAVGKAIENSYPTTTKYGKGVVWDFSNKEFNVFTDCKDFNTFIIPLGIKELDCSQNEINLKEIRNRIRIIK